MNRLINLCCPRNLMLRSKTERSVHSSLIAGWTGILLAVTALAAEVHHVPPDREAIQGAIDAALPGDTILVAPGECAVTTPITFRGKAITLKSENGPAESILRFKYTLGNEANPCDFSRSIVVFDAAEPPEAVLSGFTLRNGFGTVQPVSWRCRGNGEIDVGGGVLVRNGGAPTIVDCVFEKNLATYGAALASLNASPSLNRCKFRLNNVQDGCNGGVDGVQMLGGAVLCADGGTVAIEGCEFFGNDGEVGGGLMVQCGARAIVKKCVFSRNGVNYPGEGGGMACIGAYLEVHDSVVEENAGLSSDHARGIGLLVLEGGEARVFNSRFSRNRSRGTGGAITVEGQGSRLVTVQCSFEDNWAFKSGGAIFVGNGCSVDLLDSTFRRNESSHNGGSLTIAGQSTARVRNCAFLLSYAIGGGGMFCYSDSRLVFESSVLLGASLEGIRAYESAIVELRNSILWDIVDLPLIVGANTRVEHCIIQGETVWPGPGNSNADPLFVSTDDVHLRPGSPAMDRGTAEGIIDRDLSGNARPCGAGVDIGVYEAGDCALERFRRGDIDGSDGVSLTDAISILGYLFLGQPTPACLDAADADDDGAVLISDPIYLLRHLFVGGAPVPAPGALCGEDPTTDAVSCAATLGCTG